MPLVILKISTKLPSNEHRKEASVEYTCLYVTKFVDLRGRRGPSSILLSLQKKEEDDDPDDTHIQPAGQQQD
jgi:hypothetical protein